MLPWVLWLFCLVLLRQEIIFAQPQRDSLDALIRSCERRTDLNAARILADVADGYIEFDSHYALTIAQRAENLVSGMSATPERIHVLNILANVYRADNKYKESARCYENALTMARSIKAQSEIMLALSGCGWLLLEQGKLDKALENFLGELETANNMGDKRGIISAMMHLAGLYHETKNYARSDSLYSEALHHCGDSSYDDLRSTIYNNAGILYQEMGQSERAIEAHRSCLMLKRRLGQTRSIGRSYNNIGEVFTYQQKFDSALFYQTEALRLYQETRLCLQNE